MPRPLSVLLAAGLLVLLSVAAWYYVDVQSAGRQFKAAIIGGRSTNDGFVVTNGNLFVESPNPGVIFATTQIPGEAERISYLALVKYHASHTTDGQGGTLSYNNASDRRVGDARDRFEVNGAAIDAAYRLELNAERTQAATETLTLARQPVDLAAGRLLLIEVAPLKPNGFSWVQKNVTLPELPGVITSAVELERFAKSLQQTLRGVDPEIDAYLPEGQ